MKCVMKPSEGVNVIYSQLSMADNDRLTDSVGRAWQECAVNFKFIFCVKLGNVTDREFILNGYNIQ